MSYLAVDLDAKTAMPKVARAAGLSVGDVAWGLMELWEHAWREKTDVASGPVLAGCFGGGAATTDALVAFGFLEPTQDGYRIRGASRYLRIQEARSKGGKASSGNLKRGPKKARQPGSVPGSLPAAAGDQPGSVPGSAPALTASSEQRAANSEKKLAPAPRTPRETDALVEDFKAATGAEYRWQAAKDGTAFAALRKEFSLEEIRTRWRRGLKATGWRNVATVAQLASKWNDLAMPDAPTVAKGAGYRQPGATGEYDSWAELGAEVVNVG